MRRPGAARIGRDIGLNPESWPDRSSPKVGVKKMSELLALSFDAVLTSAIVCLVIREVIILALPDEVAGPGGWFIDTGVAEAD